MTHEGRAQLRRDVMQAEGCRLKPYRDTVGKLTIGYGRNLDDVGISTLEAEVLLDHDLVSAELEARKAWPWIATLTDARQRAITELVFNMGLPKVQQFVRTLDALRAGRYPEARTHLLDSRWAQQVGPTRAQRIAGLIHAG